MKEFFYIILALFACAAFIYYGLWRAWQPEVYDQEPAMTTPVPDTAVNDAGGIADEPLVKKRADAGQPTLPSLPPINKVILKCQNSFDRKFDPACRGKDGPVRDFHLEQLKSGFLDEED